MATTAKIDVPTKLFNSSYLFLMREPFRTADVMHLYGGTGSGKSVFVAQRDVLDMVNEERNFLLVRKFANTLRSTVFEERRKAINALFLTPLFEIRESDLTITYRPRKTVMIFRGLDDPEKLKSITVPVGNITDIRYEEATEMAEPEVDEVSRRMRGLSKVPKREVYTYNPIFRRHWICRRFFKGQDVKYTFEDGLLIMRSTYRDNRFLTDQDRKKYESYTGYQRDVYRDGKWGVLGDLIFTNWEVTDLSGRQFDKVRYGLDFGFTNDPGVVLEVAVDTASRTLYILRELFSTGMTNDVLATRAEPIVGKHTVWCDSAEPKSIQELRNHGIQAYPVQKGRDSVWHAIQWLQQWHIIIDKRCQHTIDEMSTYQWQKDKYGENMNEPVGDNDHTIAALRYATERDRLAGSVAIV